MNIVQPHKMVRPGRKITGMSAILLPYANGEVDWAGFERHVVRTQETGLIPAVNMDTGYITVINDEVRNEALRRAQSVLRGGRFVAGAWVNDNPGDTFDPAAYSEAISEICGAGGTPVIMQSFGLTGLPEEEIAGAYSRLAGECDSFIAFELGTDFAPFGRIYSIETYKAILEIEKCLGAKHSSLNRELEWRRLAVRDDLRPDFLVLTGNDRAIDMVIYGSDYLLGLSTFAPDCFALRDRLWEAEDPGFYELNDLLQFLGNFAFRDPVPAYKSNAAQFLKLQGWIDSDETPPGATRRPDSDIEVLKTILHGLDEWRSRK